MLQPIAHNCQRASAVTVPHFGSPTDLVAKCIDLFLDQVQWQSKQLGFRHARR
jgi:hypothetical protein